MQTLSSTTGSLPTTPPEPPPPGPPPPGQVDPDGRGPSSDPTRSGARWVGATGTALLLAAAAVLTAVRWDEIGQSAKLGGLVAITLAMLSIGRRVRSTIPMTASAIFHLGAGLVPFDMAAIAILAGWSWQRTLLLTALTAVGSWYGFERVEGSAVLRWGAHLAVVVAAAGVAAVSGASAPLVLAAVAAVALVARQSNVAAFWAIVAGFAPLASLIDWPVRIADAANDLGFVATDRWQLGAAGLIASAVAVYHATRTRHLELAWTTVGLAVATAIVAYANFSTGQVGAFVGLGAMFVAIEMLAFATKGDELWRRVTGSLAIVAEVVAAALTMSLGAMAVFGDLATTQSHTPTLVIAAALYALGWLTADRRRLTDKTDWIAGLLLGSNWVPTTLMFPAAVMTGAALVAPSDGWVAAVLIALGAWMIGTRRTLGSHLGALLGVVAALVVESTSPVPVIIGVAVAAAALMSYAARLRIAEAPYRQWSPKTQARFGEGSLQTLASIVLAGVAGLFWLTAWPALVELLGRTWAVPMLAAGFWALSWLIELPVRNAFSKAAGWVGRGFALLTLIGLADLDPYPGLALVGVVVVASCIDYWQSSRRIALAVAGATLALAGIPLAALVCVALAPGGAAMTVAAFVAVGLLLALPKEWELPLGALAGSLSVVGFALAAPVAPMLAIALMTIGSTVVLLGAALRQGLFVTGGGVIVAVGFWMQLTLWGITWLEPYLVFPAIAALVVGYRAMQNGMSSWIAYAPTLVAFAGVAELDRVTGGSGWHGVIAGAVGVTAVIAGGYRRLAGPLITGTAILATVVGYESLGPAALVPTWGWLAIGGSVLLGAAVAMERADTSPLETGQRLRHVIETRYS